MSSVLPGVETQSPLPNIEDFIRFHADRIENKRKALQSQAPKNTKLPSWPSPVRAVPNGFLRSSLFGAIAKGPRRYINGENLAAIGGVTIRYKGERLDQGDLDVWQNVLHAAHSQELGSQCRLTSYALLKLLGKTDTGKNRATLQARIERLVANAVTIEQQRHIYIGSLIRFAAKDDVTQEWIIELDEKLCPLFGADQFTQIEWAVRHALGGHQLAQWLHGFYASHAKPLALKIETLHRLCGSEAGDLWKFAQTLRKALGAVTKVSQDHGQKFSYEIKGDIVHIKKKAWGTQRRHLVRKAAKSRCRSSR